MNLLWYTAHIKHKSDTSSVWQRIKRVKRDKLQEEKRDYDGLRIKEEERLKESAAKSEEKNKFTLD